MGLCLAKPFGCDITAESSPTKDPDLPQNNVLTGTSFAHVPEEVFVEPASYGVWSVLLWDKIPVDRLTEKVHFSAMPEP